MMPKLLIETVLPGIGPAKATLFRRSVESVMSVSATRCTPSPKEPPQAGSTLVTSASTTCSVQRTPSQ